VNPVTVSPEVQAIVDYVTAVPHPRSEAAGPDRSGRRSLAVALLSGALGAAVALLSTRQSWSEGTATVAGEAFPLTAKGSDVTGVPASLAIVGLAALVAVFAVRSSGRFLAPRCSRSPAAGTVLAAVLGASDSSALDEKPPRPPATPPPPRTRSATPPGRTSPRWAGRCSARRAARAALRRLWPAMSGRYERDGTPRPRKAKALRPRPARGHLEGARPRRGPDGTGSGRHLRTQGGIRGLPRVAGPGTSVLTRRIRRARGDPPLTARTRVRDNDVERPTHTRTQQRGASHGGQQPRSHPGRWTVSSSPSSVFCVSGAFMVMADPLGSGPAWSSSSSAVFVGMSCGPAGLGQPKASPRTEPAQPVREAVGAEGLTPQKAFARGGPGPLLRGRLSHVRRRAPEAREGQNASGERRNPEGDAGRAAAAARSPYCGGSPSPAVCSRPSVGAFAYVGPSTPTSPGTTRSARCCATRRVLPRLRAVCAVRTPSCTGTRDGAHGQRARRRGVSGVRDGVDRLGVRSAREGRCGSISDPCSCGVSAHCCWSHGVRNLPVGAGYILDQMTNVQVVDRRQPDARPTPSCGYHSE